jgi:hypothetical protein
MPAKKFKAKVVMTPGSVNLKSPGKGRPKKPAIKSTQRGKYKANYSDAQLRDALLEVRNGTMSERAASKAYGIPRSTLKDRIGERVERQTAGRPPVLTEDEENLIVERLVMQGEWGFPLTSLDLRNVIKDYLDSQGRTTRFVDNMPGLDFVPGFLRRHPTLSVRKANLVKRSRAAVTHEIVKEFFAKFAVSAEGIPPSHIFNYDETYLQENPGCVKAIYRKGTKHAEHVRNHSKTSISCMICASGTGWLLPPYVVYRGVNVYAAWCKGGVKNARYSSTKSGWFDTFTFTDWFKNLFLPAVRRLEGRKLLLGDNLSSHISIEVIELCRENDIAFVCLPANSTDKLQPLDVGLFAPMKANWRKQLRSYADKDPTSSLLQKTEFPRMLKELLESLNTEELLPKAKIT